MYPVSHVLRCLCQEVEGDLLLGVWVEGSQAKPTVEMMVPWHTTEDNLRDLCHLCVRLSIWRWVGGGGWGRVESTVWLLCTHT